MKEFDLLLSVPMYVRKNWLPLWNFSNDWIPWSSRELNDLRNDTSAPNPDNTQTAYIKCDQTELKILKSLPIINAELQ